MKKILTTIIVLLTMAVITAATKNTQTQTTKTNITQTQQTQAPQKTKTTKNDTTQTKTTKNDTTPTQTIPFGNILFLNGDVKVKVIGGKYYLLYFCAESISPTTKISLKKELEDSKGDLTKANAEIIKQLSNKRRFCFQAGPFNKRDYEYFLSNLSTGAFELQRNKDTSWAETMNGKKIIVSADPNFIASVDLIRIKTTTTEMKKLRKRRHEDLQKKTYENFLRSITTN